MKAYNTFYSILLLLVSIPISSGLSLRPTPSQHRYLKQHDFTDNNNFAEVSNFFQGKTPSEPSFLTRRKVFGKAMTFAIANLAVTAASTLSPRVASAYTPDSDKLRESLYLVSRVQEATVQQQRFVSNSKLQEELKQKMSLTLRLVEKNYRLLDQINYASNFVSPQDEIITATEAGNEAVEALQSAIDFVRDDLKSGLLRADQKEFLTSALTETREKLFIFLKYMPSQKLEEARIRVEEENVLNRDEYDGDSDAGVYNPVKLPWK